MDVAAGAPSCAPSPYPETWPASPKILSTSETSEPKKRGRPRKDPLQVFRVTGGTSGVGTGPSLPALPEPGTPARSRNAHGYCDRTQTEVLWRCSDCGAIWRTSQQCGRLDCEVCAESNTSKRTARFWRSIGGAYLGAWVFTFPRDWVLGPDQLRELRRMVVQTVSDFYAEVFGVRVGIVVSMHPEGDKRPGWKPHFHVLVPAVGVSVGEDPVVKSLRYKLSPAELLHAKRLWACRVLWPVADALGVDRPDPQLRYNFRVTRTARLHRIEYDVRTFPAWSASSTQELHSLLVPRRYGLLAPGARSPALVEWRKRVAGEDERDEGMPCPACDGTLQTLDVLRKWSEKWRLWQGFGEWIPRRE